jgi:DNA-directed RNA polymerase specialized sigma24 family protein
VAAGVTSDQSRFLTTAEEVLLVARAAQRDLVAYLRLWEAYVDRTFRHLYYRVTSTSEAEDLTEKVFLKAWEAINHRGTRGMPFGPWLYRLTPQHQQVIVLRFVEGLSDAEVSEIIGRSEDATRRIQHGALRALGRILAARGAS